MGDFARRAIAGVTNIGGGNAIGQVRGMKTKSSVKRLCDGCKVGLINFPQWSTLVVVVMVVVVVAGGWV